MRWHSSLAPRKAEEEMRLLILAEERNADEAVSLSHWLCSNEEECLTGLLFNPSAETL